MADTSHPHVHHARNPDRGAAFMGLLVGVLALLLIVATVSMLTSRHYANEKPAAEAQH
jgi:hypothetical protein